MSAVCLSLLSGADGVGRMLIQEADIMARIKVVNQRCRQQVVLTSTDRAQLEHLQKTLNRKTGEKWDYSAIFRKLLRLYGTKLIDLLAKHHETVLAEAAQ